MRAVERATITQRKCKRWHDERRYRLTASNFGLIVKRQRNHSTLAKQILYKKNSCLSVAAVMWGQQHETDALNSYKKSLKPGQCLKEAGIFVSCCGVLGATPDGVVCNGNKTIKLVEVKCPFKARHGIVREMCNDNSFYCSLDSNLKPMLKRTHQYFFQVQGQMAVTNINSCDFVVWTPTEFTVETIPFDAKFWKEICYPSLRNFFFNFILPEIIYPKHPEDPFDYSTVCFDTHYQ